MRLHMVDQLYLDVAVPLDKSSDGCMILALCMALTDYMDVCRAVWKDGHICPNAFRLGMQMWRHV